MRVSIRSLPLTRRSCRTPNLATALNSGQLRYCHSQDSATRLAADPRMAVLAGLPRDRHVVRTAVR
jgi:hypothetical protein